MLISRKSVEGGCLGSPSKIATKPLYDGVCGDSTTIHGHDQVWSYTF